MKGLGSGARLASVVWATLAALLAAAPHALAAITAVEISLDSVQSFEGGSARLLRFEGAVVGMPLVQIDYPLNLVVFEPGSGRYVRYDLSTGAVTGAAPQLLDGATASESLALLDEGSPLAGCDVAFVGEGRIDVRIPRDALGGTLEAYAFVLYEGQALMSNQVAVEVAP